ncbi:NADPH2 dehydrogenase [Amphibacillus marinus]|uniref:NADPH2 dehydrogenase n=1 Tax=Amphibacillus marinus TaxID=872970 RepID=A0A1H8GA13_9BACI|nr:NADPH dehydrogenase NamA [Amphibacillus marinus]SEN40594.1 NADPH2 dehydrogenase [Amphibacillus marinus]
MTVKLFEPITFKSVTLPNRIVMAPMCMFSVEQEDGQVTPFHITHYETRAVGQVGLVMLEATAILPEGRIKTTDLGIWHDTHINGLKTINARIHAHQVKSAIQLAHAGRKARTGSACYAPSQLAASDSEPTPVEMTIADIQKVIDAFKEGAIRAKAADFDIIELHAAHGYLINQFLSPLANKRIDHYGGSRENRYRFLKEIIAAVKTVWQGPIFVRISADEYDAEGNSMDDFIYFSTEMKQQGIDLIDVSTGGIAQHAKIDVFPGYQTKHAEIIKHQANIATGAVGLITEGIQAEEILKNERADLIFIGRALLKNPYWAKEAADQLEYELTAPQQYIRGWQ